MRREKKGKGKMGEEHYHPSAKPRTKKRGERGGQSKSSFYNFSIDPIANKGGEKRKRGRGGKEGGVLTFSKRRKKKKHKEKKRHGLQCLERGEKKRKVKGEKGTCAGERKKRRGAKKKVVPRAHLPDQREK